MVKGKSLLLDEERVGNRAAFPKITVITVCYNSGNTLEKTILSVINQNYVNLEYIIVDGASTDRTTDILRKYSSQINKIISEPDCGISDAFNKGIRAATGDIICIVNSDDRMGEGDLSRFVAAYRPEVDVFRGSEKITGGGKRGKILKPTLRYSKIPIHFHCCHMATFISRIAYEKYGLYDTDYQICMDRELLFRFHFMGAKEIKIPGVYGEFTRGGVSSTNYSKLDHECCLIQEKYCNPSRVEKNMYKKCINAKRFIQRLRGEI